MRLVMICSPCVACSIDQRLQLVQFLGGHFRGRPIHECGGSLGGGSVEKGGEHVLQRAGARLLPRDFGQKYVARAVRLMPDVPLLLQDAQQRARGGVAGRIGERRQDLGRRRLAPAVEDIENLALAAA